MDQSCSRRSSGATATEPAKPGSSTEMPPSYPLIAPSASNPYDLISTSPIPNCCARCFRIRVDHACPIRHRPNESFICRLNRHRSATAERIFCKRKDLDVRSAGTEEDALVRVNARMLDWAEVIFAMDPLQIEALRRMFPAHPALERVICLDIEDV